MKLKILAKENWSFDELQEAISKKDSWRLPSYDEIKEHYYHQDFNDICFFVKGDVKELAFGGKLVPYVRINDSEITKGFIHPKFKLSGAVMKPNSKESFFDRLFKKVAI